MNLSNISFPVYLLGYEKPTSEDGVVFFYRSEQLYVIDDTTIDHPTLADRRLELVRRGVKLYNIKLAVFFLGDFIKLVKPSMWFIDSNGVVFNHKKTVSMKLIFRKISKVIPADSGFIIEVDGINCRFKCLYAPKGKIYAGILKNGASYILYGLYENTHKETIRRI